MSKDYDPLDLDAQDADASEASRATSLDQDQEAEDLKWLMAHRQGRRIMARLFERTGVNRPTFVENDPAGRLSSYNEGLRNEGTRFYGLIVLHCRDRLIQLLKETF